MIQTLTSQHLSPEAIRTLLEHLPDFVKVALAQKTEEMECPIEAAVEMAVV
jgi:hypothetical protein